MGPGFSNSKNGARWGVKVQILGDGLLHLALRALLRGTPQLKALEADPAGWPVSRRSACRAMAAMFVGCLATGMLATVAGFVFLTTTPADWWGLARWAFCGEAFEKTAWAMNRSLAHWATGKFFAILAGGALGSLAGSAIWSHSTALNARRQALAAPTGPLRKIGRAFPAILLAMAKDLRVWAETQPIKKVCAWWGLGLLAACWIGVELSPSKDTGIIQKIIALGLSTPPFVAIACGGMAAIVLYGVVDRAKKTPVFVARFVARSIHHAKATRSASASIRASLAARSFDALLVAVFAFAMLIPFVEQKIVRILASKNLSLGSAIPYSLQEGGAAALNNGSTFALCFLSVMGFVVLNIGWVELPGAPDWIKKRVCHAPGFFRRMLMAMHKAHATNGARGALVELLNGLKFWSWRGRELSALTVFALMESAKFFVAWKITTWQLGSGPSWVGNSLAPSSIDCALPWPSVIGAQTLFLGGVVMSLILALIGFVFAVSRWIGALAAVAGARIAAISLQAGAHRLAREEAAQLHEAMAQPLAPSAAASDEGARIGKAIGQNVLGAESPPARKTRRL